MSSPSSKNSQARNSQAERPNTPVFRGTERYEVLERLGIGGMGTVYAVLDRSTGAKVALKHLHQHRPDSLELFKREFRNFQDITHRNLISLGELRADGGEWFFTMELLIGKTFDEFVRAGAHALDATVQRSSTFLARGVSMPSSLFNGMVRRVSASEQPRSRRRLFHEGRLRDALSQLACGMAVLHRANKVHSDIKPSNIVIESSGRLVLLDFGIAIDISEDRHLLSDRILGTVSHMAPEQIDPSATSPASDCYAVGILMYEALTGTRPFPGQTFKEVLELKNTRQPRLPGRVADGIPADLERLCLELLAIEPAARPSATDILHRLNAWDMLAEINTDAADELSDGDVFVGRKKALETLLAASRPPIASRIVALTGPSGVGKTALLDRFRTRLADALVLGGRCHERESVPFKGIDTVIQTLLDHLRQLGPTELEGLIPRDVARIADVFPRFGLLFDVDSVTTDKDATPYQQRRAAFAELRELMARLARRTQVVITIDDMQWADSDTWALIGHLVHKPHPPPMLLILAMRTRDDGKLDELEQLGDVDHVSLPPLTLAESRAMAVHLLTCVDRPDDALAEEIARASEGHPLFIREIIRYAGEQLELDVRSDLLDEALQARFASLSAEAKRLLQVLATATTPLKHATIAQAADVNFERYLRIVSELRGRYLVQTTGIELEHTIALDHERVRAAVIAHQSDEALVELHLRLAESLEQDSAEAAPELLAHHLLAGGEPERASGFWLQAAEQAMDSLAFDTASWFYRSALSTDVFSEPERQRILLRLAEALVDSGRGHEAGDAFLQVAGATDDRALQLRCLYRAGEQLLLCGELERGREALRRVLAAIDSALPTTRRGIIWSYVRLQLWLRIRGLRWRERKAEDIAEYQLLRLDIKRSSARVMTLVEPMSAALLHGRALLLALRVGEPVRIGWCLAFEAAVSAAGNRAGRVRALALLDMAEHIAERVDDVGLHAWIATNRASVAYFAGRYRDAFGLAIEAVQQFVGLPGHHWERINAQTLHLFVLRSLGEFRELGDLREQYLHEAMERGDLHTQAAVRHASSMVWLSADDVAGARRDIAKSPQWTSESFDRPLQQWYEMLTRGEIALYETDERPAQLDSLAELATIDKTALATIQSVRVEWRFLRGRLLIATAPEQRPKIHRLIRSLEREPSLFGPIAAAYLSAALAALDRDAEGMRECLQRAESQASDAGAEWMCQAARYWRGRNLNGEGGDTLVDLSLAWMSAQGIVNPQRFARMLMPVPLDCLGGDTG